MQFGERAGQAILNEIVGRRDIAAQRPSITPQARDFGFDTLVQTVHKGLLSTAEANPGVASDRGSVRMSCNPMMAVRTVLCKKL
jgi:hypothetical protein